MKKIRLKLILTGCGFLPLALGSFFYHLIMNRDDYFPSLPLLIGGLFLLLMWMLITRFFKKRGLTDFETLFYLHLVGEMSILILLITHITSTFGSSIHILAQNYFLSLLWLTRRLFIGNQSMITHFIVNYLILIFFCFLSLKLTAVKD